MNQAPLLKSILLLEDEASFRDILEIGLAPQGFDPFPAASLSEAKRLLTERSFDAVVSDLRLKDGTGIDLLS